MTQLHHISLFILSLSLSLTTTLSLTFGLSPSPPVPSPDGSSELVTPKSTPSQPLTPQSTDTIGNFSNIPNTGPYKCSKTSPFAPARPFFGDCQSAIRLLPQDPTTGHFHTRDPSDLYRLPRFETVSTCRVVIGLDHTATAGEDGSWASVRLTAAELNLRCVYFGALQGFFGGSTTAGASGLITVVLHFSGQYGLGDNETEKASS